MVSRSNLSGRGPYEDGVLGRAYKGPSGPGKIVRPGEEAAPRDRGKRLLQGRDAGPATVQPTGPENLRPGGRMSTTQQLATRGSRGGRERPQMSEGLIDPAQVGIKESLGEAYVAPTEQPINKPAPARRRPRGLADMVRQAQEQAAGRGVPAKRGGIAGMVTGAVQTAREAQAARTEAERAERYPTTSPGVGETAYRPGYTPPTDYVSTEASQARAAREAAAERTGGGRSESDVTPRPTLRSPRSRSRRNIRR